jgi:hypothetical protein
MRPWARNVLFELDVLLNKAFFLELTNLKGFIALLILALLE